MNKRLYALFEVKTLPSGRKSYKRLDENGYVSRALPKDVAIRIYQNRLLAGSFGQASLVELRPAKAIEHEDN
jgi:hypothetical protein